MASDHFSNAKNDKGARSDKNFGHLGSDVGIWYEPYEIKSAFQTKLSSSLKTATFMMKFSDRMRITKPPLGLYIDSMPEALRN